MTDGSPIAQVGEDIKLSEVGAWADASRTKELEHEHADNSALAEA